jgi:hypothetical protein
MEPTNNRKVLAKAGSIVYRPSQLVVSKDPLISSRESQKATVRSLTSLLSMKMKVS